MPCWVIIFWNFLWASIFEWYQDRLNWISFRPRNQVFARFFSSHCLFDEHIPDVSLCASWLILEDELFSYAYFFSLFKWFLIVLVLQGGSTRDFNIFDVDEFSFFYFVNNYSLEQWWWYFWPASWFLCSILIWNFQVIADYGFTAFRRLWNFSLRFSDSFSEL